MIYALGRYCSGALGVQLGVFAWAGAAPRSAKWRSCGSSAFLIANTKILLPEIFVANWLAN